MKKSIRYYFFLIFPYVYIIVNNSNYLMAVYILDKILNYWIEVVYFYHIKVIMSEMTLSMQGKYVFSATLNWCVSTVQGFKPCTPSLSILLWRCLTIFKKFPKSQSRVLLISSPFKYWLMIQSFLQLGLDKYSREFSFRGKYKIHPIH